jgi:NADH:ubiquinone oxidoreductase subunit 3 (subunit A)
MKFALNAILFVVFSIIGCVMIPFLAIQYPLVCLVVVAAGIYLFSRAFAQKKKFQ